MGTLFDYLLWRGDISFGEMGINQVDNLIFSELSYLNYESLVPEDYSRRLKLSEVSEAYFALRPRKKNMLGILPADELQQLLEAAAKTERFKNAELWGYCNQVDRERESQFSAICYSVPGNRCYIAYRGTDNSIAGWKENFNMAFMFPVPAQERAAEYLKQAACQTKELLHVGGHSKGGNLAEYASATAGEQLQWQIEHIWSNDGPGFMPEFLQTEGYRNIRDRITKLMPAASVVGVLLQSDCESILVESSAFGPKQHEGLSWNCLGGSFIKAESSTAASRIVDETADNMVKDLSIEQRREIIEAVFAAIYATGAESLQQLLQEGMRPKELGSFFDNIELEPELKLKFIRALMNSFHVDERITGFLLNKKLKSLENIKTGSD